ncbi:receptor activity-modifying protein 1 [Pleuronectes platessa]|uniref:receptor activity-modifying protein 1 n=1 Tax=Pleuronectes platessa TaxID=8262 RepID=UPI00232A4C70|nr:receptor activity-modifying protein 1 [Pleuronectes platessa]
MELTVCFLALGFIGTGMATQKKIPPCDELMFHNDVDNCLLAFNHSMETSGYEDRCPWPAVKGVYYQLQICVNLTAGLYWCKGYKSLLDEVYLAVHRKYFSLCGLVRDPPAITLMLLISPSIIITLLMPLVCLPLVTEGQTSLCSGV